MLINQARNLASLPYSSLQQLQQSVQRTQQLLQQAQGIALNVQQIDRCSRNTATSRCRPRISSSSPVRVSAGRTRSAACRTPCAFRPASSATSTPTGPQMSSLVGQSQGATGALQATQAGNQLLALPAQQLADLTAVVAANGRAQSLSEAERAAAAEQGREQRRRFLTPGFGLPARQRAACSRAATEDMVMDGKMLARLGRRRVRRGRDHRDRHRDDPEGGSAGGFLATAV
jgi:conjugal transfer/entry exclusion protein